MVRYVLKGSASAAPPFQLLVSGVIPSEARDLVFARSGSTGSSGKNQDPSLRSG